MADRSPAAAVDDQDEGVSAKVLRYCDTRAAGRLCSDIGKAIADIEKLPPLCCSHWDMIPEPNDAGSKRARRRRNQSCYLTKITFIPPCEYSFPDNVTAEFIFLQSDAPAADSICVTTK